MATVAETLSNEYTPGRIVDISVIATMIPHFMFVSIYVDISITANNNPRDFMREFIFFALSRADYTKHLP